MPGLWRPAPPVGSKPAAIAGARPVRGQSRRNCRSTPAGRPGVLFARRRSDIVAAPFSSGAPDLRPVPQTIRPLLESPSMRDVCRLLWSAILLTSLGCQSMPQASTGLAERLSDALRAPTKEPARGEGLAALIASRRSKRPDRQRQEQQGQQPRQAPALPGRWARDEVLQMVVDQELENATPQEREALMQRLANASEDEVADVLINRRQALQTAAASRSAASEPSAADPSARQIILTRRPQADAPSTPMQAAALAGHSGRPPDQTEAAHPLTDGSARLAAPTPGGGRHPPP